MWASAALVAFGLRVAEPAVVWGVGGALALCLVLAAGVLGRPGGYVVGSVLQVPVVAVGVAVPTMLVMGGIFAVLWVVPCGWAAGSTSSGGPGRVRRRARRPLG